MPSMTLKQLQYLCKQCRGSQNSISYKAAEMVLVQGMSDKEAEFKLNASPQAVHNGVARYKGLLEELQDAFDLPKNNQIDSTHSMVLGKTKDGMKG